MIRISQDTRWTQNYEFILLFIEKSGRNPSKYRDDERWMKYWIKRNRRKMADGLLTDEQQKKFQTLLEIYEKSLRVNQYDDCSLEFPFQD